MMHRIRSHFIFFGLASGAVIAIPLTLIMCVWEWIENPGGIFHGPGGTNWSFVFDTAMSWFVPTFLYVAVIASVLHLLHTGVRLMVHKYFRNGDPKEDA